MHKHGAPTNTHENDSFIHSFVCGKRRKGVREGGRENKKAC